MAIKINTHEQYVQRIYRLALRSPTLTKTDKEKLRAIKLVYGDGPDGTLGITRFNRWEKKGGKKPQRVPFVSVCGHIHSSHVQLCDTVLHELGHVLAGPLAGHGPEWQKACGKLGFPGAKAAGAESSWEWFDKWMRAQLRKIPKPKDGSAVVGHVHYPTPNGAAGPMHSPGSNPGNGGPVIRIRPCSLGHGTRGGKSRGPGSGSRSLLYRCRCTQPVKIRHAGRDLYAICGRCNRRFTLVESSVPAAQQQGDATHPGAKELRDAYLRQAAATRKAFRAAGMI